MKRLPKVTTRDRRRKCRMSWMLKGPHPNKKKSMSATITTAPALVREVEIHCVHAYEKKRQII